MNKRPFYLIRHEVDCDGYSTYVDYIGVNAKAAIERFKFLIGDIEERYFRCHDANVYYGGVGIEFVNDLTPQDITTPGQSVRLGINDDCECWITVSIEVIHTGEFFNYQYGNGYGYRGYNNRIYTDDNTREERYKLAHPEAKF